MKAEPLSLPADESARTRAREREGVCLCVRESVRETEVEGERVRRLCLRFAVRRLHLTCAVSLLRR